MDAYTNGIVTHTAEVLDAATKKDRKKFTEALKGVEDTM